MEGQENPKLCEAKAKHNRVLSDGSEGGGKRLGASNLTLWIRRC